VRCERRLISTNANADEQHCLGVFVPDVQAPTTRTFCPVWSASVEWRLWPLKTSYIEQNRTRKPRVSSRSRLEARSRRSRRRSGARCVRWRMSRRQAPSLLRSVLASSRARLRKSRLECSFASELERH
jgi:hypothetical protein